MKKTLLIPILLALSLLCSSCMPVMVIPNSDSIGNSKTFESDGIKLLLTDRFVERESQRGFDAYYEADFAGVMLLIEEFTLEEGLAERSLEQYVKNVIANNGHTDIQPQSKDGLWYYINDTEQVRYYSFSYKGSDAFYIVQYSCLRSDVAMLEDTIFLWAQAVEVE